MLFITQLTKETTDYVHCHCWQKWWRQSNWQCFLGLAATYFLSLPLFICSVHVPHPCPLEKGEFILKTRTTSFGLQKVFTTDIACLKHWKKNIFPQNRYATAFFNYIYIYIMLLFLDDINGIYKLYCFNFYY